MAIKTVTEQIYEEIRNEILSQSIPAGEKLTIKMLHERYGVSSSPIREALEHLKQDGLIEYTPNVGMRVIELSEDDLREIFELVSEFDCIALRLAASSNNLSELIDALESNQRKAIALADDDMWSRISDDFHLLFYKYANNGRLSEAASRIRTQFTFYSNAYEREPDNRLSINSEHGAVLDALKSGDLTLAENLMRDHAKSSYSKALNIL